MRNIFIKMDMVKNFNKNNVLYVILFEVINLVISMDYVYELLDSCVEIFGNFFDMKESNICYLVFNMFNVFVVMVDLWEVIKVY